MPNRSLTPSRLDRWLGSWRVALRLARRDAWGHKGRSLLSVSLIALPVAVIAFALLLFRSLEPSGEAVAPRTFGEANVAVTPAQGCAGVSAARSSTCLTDVGADAPPTGVALPELAADVAERVGQDVVPIGLVSTLSDPVADGGDAVRVLMVDGADPILAGIAELESGRWPASADEVAITAAGIDIGLPSSGEFRLGPEGEQQTVRIVGRASAAYEDSLNASVIASPDAPLTPEQVRFLLPAATGAEEVTVRQWAARGLDVLIRDSYDSLPSWTGATTGSSMIFVALGVGLGAALVLETVLLAAPAFAIGAARRRHSLALASAQGGSPADLRRTVLSAGLVLGSVAAATGLLLGAVTGVTYLRWRGSANPSLATIIDVPWSWLVLLTAVAVLAAAVAAWWPARGIGWLNTMSVLRGSTLAPRVGRGAPILGLALVAAGLVIALAGSPSSGTGGVAVGLGFALVPIGTLLLIPTALALAARLTRGFPLATRMAARDNLRQRSRAVPTVAAVFGAVLTVTALSTTIATVEERNRADYRPSTIVGTASGGVEPGQTEAVEAAVAEVSPDLRVDYVRTAQLDEPAAASPGAGPAVEEAVALVDAACTAADLTSATPRQECSPQVSNTMYSFANPAVLDSALIRATPGLDDAARQALLDGAILILSEESEGRPALSLSGATRARPVVFTSDDSFASWELAADAPTGPGESNSETPVEVLTASAQVAAQIPWPGQVLLSTETADRIGWESAPQQAVLSAPDGALRATQVAAVNEELTTVARFTVETGEAPPRTTAGVIAVILSVFGGLALVATLVGTALYASETRADSATLSAIGSRTGFRRALAAMHAAQLTVIGGGLGVIGGYLLGTAAGIFSLAGRRSIGLGDGLGMVVLPWQPPTLVAAVALCAAGLAWACVGRAPALTRRTI